jgi:phage-related protein
MSNDFRGDFLGFTFNTTHSSELGIVRVNTGNRGHEDLSPKFKDITVDIPGSDGIYYLSSQYQERQFQIDFAFDDLGENDIKSIRELFGDNKIHDLVFDEQPYKAYSCKVSLPTKLSYICFDNEDASARVYKGEGNVVLTAYYPFAKAPKKTWTEYVSTTVGEKHYDENGVCIEEWAQASGLKNSLSGYDNFGSSAEALLYNPGDIDSPLSMVIQVLTSGTLQISYTKGGNTKGKVIIDTSELTIGAYYRFNSKIKILEGGTYGSGAFTPDGTIYNSAIIAGDFFKIEPAPSTTVQKLVRTSTTIAAITNIQYDYLYL